MSYYEDRIKALEARIEEMAKRERFKAIPVEARLIENIIELQEENARLKAEVERLTKAVMHSPAAQLKLKELEGKTTFEEINPKDDNSNINTELLALSNRQASDIRRLTKAGDAMAEELNGRYFGKRLINDWNAAKEGKGQRS